MDALIKAQLKEWAKEYHNSDFIANDPVQFPHRFSEKREIEIAGLLTALLSFGNRVQILKKVDELLHIMQHHPYQYLMSEQWRKDFPADRTTSFYRMCSYQQMHRYFQLLYDAFQQHSSLEDALNIYQGSPIEKICSFLGVSSKQPQKKLNMFLRWMIRRDSPVDFGIWLSMHPRELLIPLDTHVCRMSNILGLTEGTSFTLSNVKRITNALQEIFPDDPCMGDFALFGAGVNGVLTPIK